MTLYNRIGQGTYWRALNIARCLVKSGHKVTLVATSKEQLFKFHIRDDHGVYIIESPDLLTGKLRSGWDLWNVICRIYRLRNMHFDLVHTFECRPVALYPALYIHKTHKIPLITDWGDWFGVGGSVEERTNQVIRFLLRPIETYFETKFRSIAQGTTVINTVLRDKVIQLGVAPSTVLLLRNGSDYERIEPEPMDNARLRLGIASDVPIIGYIGSIFHRDAKLMATAFMQILETNPQAKLLVAGYFNEDIESMLGKPSSVIRTGPLCFNQIGSVLSVCDICWLPLKNSGANQGRWPLKLNDYMAAGRPIVATDVGDLREFITQNGIGLVSDDTPEELSCCVNKLIEHPELSQLMGDRARHLAETEYSWETIVKKLEEFYTYILADNCV